MVEGQLGEHVIRDDKAAPMTEAERDEVQRKHDALAESNQKIIQKLAEEGLNLPALSLTQIRLETLLNWMFDKDTKLHFEFAYEQRVSAFLKSSVVQVEELKRQERMASLVVPEGKVLGGLPLR